MGKNKNKKGKGAEKTAAKTEKKLSKKQKKDLADLGEDDVEQIVAKCEMEEKKKQTVAEVAIERPAKRSSFAFVAHPEKDELFLFGGEFFNGQKTAMYNDIVAYNLNKGTWTSLVVPKGPAPRSGHQMVAVPGGKGGQLWLFGGEFASPSLSQFYHYNDLWVYQIGEKSWQKINCPGGPSARSGHRMVLHKRQLILFGGYHDNNINFKYFNDVYAFDLKDYKWRKLEPAGIPPAPRSACLMAVAPSGKILVCGGYSKTKVKKDVDKGHTHADSFFLTPEKGDETGTKWKWVSAKCGGASPLPRGGMALTPLTGGKAFAFGGVRDEEGEEDLSGTFLNDSYFVDLETNVWRYVSLSGKKDPSKKSRRRRKDSGDADDMDDEGEQMEEEPQSVVTSNDGIFKVTIGPSPAASAFGGSNASGGSASFAFCPPTRMSAGLAFKHGKAYLFGGQFEEGDRQLTFCDLYSLDVHKMDEWQTVLPNEVSPDDWLDSGSSSDDDDDSEDDDEGEDSEESPMDTD
ncbi:kelch domain-containing protein 4 [Cloeon dipterum]|uniref:kelch domain-containing protein 4 n=1 Tax=Cloeon dipterum TaxID=197152 RepID=UPI0032208031